MSVDDDSVFASLQHVAGCRYNRAEYNRDIIDSYILRKAREKGIRLPTGGPPDEYKYLGAKVFQSVAGMSESVVYCDISSMYPSLIVTLNLSPETVVGTETELDESQYTADDCVHGYVDTRPVKHLNGSEDGWQQFTSGGYKMVYDPEQNAVKWTCDEGSGPRYEKLYVLSRDVETGFLTECVDELITLKNKYRGEDLYGAIKRVCNSIYGVTGFASDNSSFRLYDWQLAEAITLCGRKMIEYSSEYILKQLSKMGYDSAYVALGDSIPGDETVVVRTPQQHVDVWRIEDLYEQCKDYDEWTGYEAWTEDGFTPIHRVIQKPNRKKMYRIRTKQGIVHVTEDHSLVRADGAEVSPEDVSVGEELLHYNVGRTVPHVPDPDCTIDTELAWLLGLFVADGSCGVYESNGAKKRPWAINKSDDDLLRRAGDVVESQFGVSADVRDYRESSGCYKLKVNGFEKGERIKFVDWFREHCYDGDEKQVPVEVLNAGPAVREAFLEGYHDGDGYVRALSAYDEIDLMQFCDRVLAEGILMLCRDAGYDVTIDHRDNHDEEYYRVRTVSEHDGSPSEIQSIEEFEYDGEYVYDLETENHHFQAGVGDIVVHNTDGCGIAVPSAATRHEALSAIEEAVEQLNGPGYDEFFAETFNVEPQHHHGEIEVESYAPKVFIPSRNPPHDDVGVKKRRIEWQTWDEDDGEIDDIDITGLEAERSDVAPITGHAQELFAETLRMDTSEARGWLFPQLREMAQSIAAGDIALSRVCKRGGVGQDIAAYGSSSRRAGPLYRGAKYANEHVDGVTIQRGDKPAVVYVTDVGDGYLGFYDTHTAEDGDRVDAVSLLDPGRLPEAFTVDWDKHLRKALLGPMRPLLETRFGADAWSQIQYGTEQAGLDLYEGQSD